MPGRSRRFIQRFHRGVDDKETVLHRLLVRKPNGQAFQGVDGGAVSGYGVKDAHLVELMNDTCGRLAVALPHH